MNIDRQFSNDKPIYVQLVQRIKRLIVSGALQPGDKLDSVRDIALDAKVNPNTVQRAFSELERTGLVYTQRTSGRFITDDVQLISDMRQELATEEIEMFFENMKQLGFDDAATIKMVKEKNHEHS
ncbi:MAG: GntR family transcriptional regulator [Clostridia bacterium]|nr:GntR family transcriptional regulator [Clostridia bacterium]